MSDRDDEREALIEVVNQARWAWMRIRATKPECTEDELIASRVAAAGFRRQGPVAEAEAGVLTPKGIFRDEPVPFAPAFIDRMPTSPETSRRHWTMYCRECGVEEFMAARADDPKLVAHTDGHNRRVHSHGFTSEK